MNIVQQNSWPDSQIPECTSVISHYAPFRTEMSTFLFSMEHCGIWHDDVIKWKHFPRYWPFVRGIHQSPVNSPHKGQWRGALMFSLICTWIKPWVNNCEASDLRCYRAHYDVTVMELVHSGSFSICRLLKLGHGYVIGLHIKPWT